MKTLSQQTKQAEPNHSRAVLALVRKLRSPAAVDVSFQRPTSCIMRSRVCRYKETRFTCNMHIYVFDNFAPVPFCIDGRLNTARLRVSGTPRYLFSPALWVHRLSVCPCVHNSIRMSCDALIRRNIAVRDTHGFPKLPQCPSMYLMHRYTT